MPYFLCPCPIYVMKMTNLTWKNPVIQAEPFTVYIYSIVQYGRLTGKVKVGNFDG